MRARQEPRPPKDRDAPLRSGGRAAGEPRGPRRINPVLPRHAGSAEASPSQDTAMPRSVWGGRASGEPRGPRRINPVLPRHAGSAEASPSQDTTMRRSVREGAPLASREGPAESIPFFHDTPARQEQRPPNWISASRQPHVSTGRSSALPNPARDPRPYRFIAPSNSTSTSFPLPLRKPCKSSVTYAYPARLKCAITSARSAGSWKRSISPRPTSIRARVSW